MSFTEYRNHLIAALDSGRIDEDAFNAAMDNADIFCDDEDDDDIGYGLPSTYAEIDYGDREDAEAYYGSRWDDMNYIHYMER